MLGMGVEACDEPLASFLRLEHGIGDQNTLATHDCDLGDGERAFERHAQAFRVELIACAFRVFAQRQQIEFEDLVNLGHLVTANV